MAWKKSKDKESDGFFIEKSSLKPMETLENLSNNSNYWRAKTEGHAYIPKNETTELAFPKFSEILNQKFFEYLAEQFSLDHNGAHGYHHWLRVLYNGRLLCSRNSANIKVVELFSLLHDSKRSNKKSDPEHGERAAIFAETMRGTWFTVTDKELQLLQDACILHSEGLRDKDVTIQTCWDADRLDNYYTEVDLNFSLLSDDLAKQELIIFEAGQRALMQAFKSA
ncbi:MAG: hypothetical protein HOO03_01255 [Rhodobacteraceae bacterium]|nr:hypothetical protein [Paracoccaceae bacterium]MBT6271479.1 hypothetical protein [Paracoccaceae bacterium]MBT6437899.1 hypothetical protein [Paracoccaceae bacterium]MDG2373615.1 hypothetical protein [Paracoccaceae bacterium]